MTKVMMSVVLVLAMASTVHAQKAQSLVGLSCNFYAEASDVPNQFTINLVDWSTRCKRTPNPFRRVGPVDLKALKATWSVVAFDADGLPLGTQYKPHIVPISSDGNGNLTFEFSTVPPSGTAVQLMFHIYYSQ